ncbi:MAG: ATP-binding protein, partial [Opitutaceae bacterium]
TKQRLDQMIADGIEEHSSLDYKRADSLAKTDGKKTEVTKDVSSFANSGGGILIYGVAEFEDEPRKYLPERLDPIQRSEISKECLDQVIQTIQPRIEGVVIYPVMISEADNTVCYVVEVPQSHTAHMARDHRYHKRHNFTTAQMEDFEVRDVMSRRTHPQIRASIFVNKRADGHKPEGVILVKLENTGRVLARNVMVELELPVDMDGIVAVDKPVLSERGADGDFHLLRLMPAMSEPPIFPGSYLTLQRKIHTDARFERVDRQPLRSTRHIKISVFADEMPPIRAKLDFAPVVLGWTPIE